MRNASVKNYVAGHVYIEQKVSEKSAKKSRTKKKYKRRDVYDLACVVCGEWFKATRRDAKFDSNKCAKRFSRARGFFIERGPARHARRPKKL